MSTAVAASRTAYGRDSSWKRTLSKSLPAWVVSGAVHVALVAVLIGIDTAMPPVQAGAKSDEELVVIPDDPQAEETEKNLTNPDIGLDAELPSTVELPNEADVNVMSEVVPDNPIGVPESQALAPVDINPPTGVGDPSATVGLAGDAGDFLKGVGAGGVGATADTFSGRSGSTKDAMLKAGGGNSATEAAVARGLIWLAKKQRGDGSWQFDGSSAEDRIAATGLALLPFLAAGQTHKPHKDNKYQKQVEAGVKFLLAAQQPTGKFKGSTDMYSHAIATMALCELLGMTGDRGRLLKPAQLAVNHIVSAQGDNGSWGYQEKQNGDTSIVGWQIQALQSARLCKDLTVPKATFERSRSFLDSVCDPSKKHTYGYADRRPKLSLTPVGLLCRYYGDGWGPNNPGMAAGVKWMMDRQMPAADKFEMYYYYYATQVVHFFGGPEWKDQWNPAMRDMLLAKQAPQDHKDYGSWEAEDGITGRHVGRLGTTCLCLLTLEVYYRHLPLYKRDTAGLRELERS